jgi:hypothetical protein
MPVISMLFTLVKPKDSGLKDESCLNHDFGKRRKKEVICIEKHKQQGLQAQPSANIEL